MATATSSRLVRLRDPWSGRQRRHFDGDERHDSAADGVSLNVTGKIISVNGSSDTITLGSGDTGITVTGNDSTIDVGSHDTVTVDGDHDQISGGSK